MPGYSIALFFHLLSLLLAAVAASLAGYAALRVRAAAGAEEALQWLALVGKIVPLFPVASVGLFATGAYMTASQSGWSEPWILASLAGLGLIVVLGAGVEGSRVRTLRRVLQSEGFSERGRRLMRDPVAWSAKLATLTVMVAVVFIMTTKPAATTDVTALVLAVVVGVLGAVPFWYAPAAAAVEAC